MKETTEILTSLNVNFTTVCYRYDMSVSNKIYILAVLDLEIYEKLRLISIYSGFGRKDACIRDFNSSLLW